MASEPNPKRNRLSASVQSWMNFMPEQLVFDKAEQGLVRFRAMFEMPNWDGVEAEEATIVVEGADERLDKIAARIYGAQNVELYWVIAARNNLDLPDVQLYKGMKLKIPSKNWIDTRLIPQAQKYLER